MDSERDEDEAYGGVKSWRVVFSGEDVVGPVFHCFGPGHPAWFSFGIGGKVKPKNEEDGGDESSWPFAGVAPALVGWVLGEIGEEDAKEGEHSKSCCLELA